MLQELHGMIEKNNNSVEKITDYPCSSWCLTANTAQSRPCSGTSWLKLTFPLSLMASCWPTVGFSRALGMEMSNLAQRCICWGKSTHLCFFNCSWRDDNFGYSFFCYNLKYSTKNNKGYSPKQGVLLKKKPV